MSYTHPNLNQGANHEECQNIWSIQNILYWDFPGDPVVKNLPSNAGDMGSIPGSGRSHCHGGTKPVPHNYWDQALEPVSCSYGSPMPRTCAPQQEKPLSFLGKLHTGPHSGYKISISTKSVDSFFTPSPAFIVCRFFDGYHYDWCEVVLICISLIISHFEHLFICLLAGHMYTFFGKMSL